MMTALLTAPRMKSKQSFSPVPRKWTTTQFHKLCDLGVFEGCRAMLIDGVILEQGPMNPPHAVSGEKTEEIIRSLFAKGWRIRGQKPLIFGLGTDPEPDLAIVLGKPSIAGGHPSTAALVIEISDTSLRFDTTEKMSLYAAAGIPDYWVLDLNNNQLLVFRDPVPDATAAHGSTYRTSATYGPTESVAPLAEPNSSIAVSDMLP